jgi:hypothetical protein
MNIRNSLGNSSNRNRIFNNFISLTSASASTAVCLYGYNNRYIDYVFNNMNLLSSSTNNTSAVAYLTSGNNIVFKNNMAIASGGGIAIRIANTSSLGSSDYNNLYTSGSVLGYIGGTSAPNLASWKSQTGEDTHSISSNPNFISSTNLHVTNVALNNLGTPITGITVDIDGDTRHATTPDIGADEFSVDIDAGITAITEPVAGCNSTQNAKVTLKNFGQNTLTSATINWKVDGTTQTAYSWSGNLTTSQSQIVTIGTVNLTPGSHTITAWSSNPNGQNDQLPANDTSTVTITISSAPVVNAGNDTTICSSVSFTTNATATGYTTLQWTSSGSGTFTGANSLTATYTPSAADITAGSVYLKLTASSTATTGGVVERVPWMIHWGKSRAWARRKSRRCCVTSAADAG